MWLRILLFSIVGLLNCKPEDVVLEYEENEELSGGSLTTFDLGENAFGHSPSNLSFEEENDFVIGNSFFRSNWTSAPASATARDGLGPIFNASSCGGCHPKDGRAAPPEVYGEPLSGLLIRLSSSANVDDPIYGGQLQDKGLLGVKPEAKVAVSYTEIPGKYADGTSYSLRKPNYEFSEWAYGEISPGFLFSPRVGNQLAGVGLLEAIPSQTILALADEDDQNKDGISGRANFVWNEQKQITELGRFGWKANQPDLLQQTASAFNGDIGITTSLFMKDHTTSAQSELQSLPNGGEPEISDENLNRVVFYLQTLSVPARRNVKDPAVLRGKTLFTEIKCASCHIPSFNTESSNAISVLNNQTIRPYTDLLLHDMGEGLADNRPDFLANGKEWRTTPLWGIGMIKTVNDHTFLLHDGRARNIEEAILWHGGEAETSKQKFLSLSAENRKDLLTFLESL